MIDTHCHLDSEEYNEIFQDIVDEIKKSEIKKVLVPSTNPGSMEKIRSLTEKYDFIYPAFGIHPEECGIENDKIKELIPESGDFAIGEIGLDHFNVFFSVEKQKKVFELQLDIAQSTGRPVIIHSRNSFPETYDIVKNFELKNVVFHCFPYGINEAKLLLDRDYYISFTGIITFKKADEIRDVVKFCPISNIMAETDGPYLAPVPFRGKLNRPIYVRYIIEKIAELKGLSFEETDNILDENFFRWIK